MAARPDLERLIFGSERERRYTQDTPVLPAVWLRYGEEPGRRQDLLLTPHQHSTAARLMRELLACLEREFGREEVDAAEVALNEGYVVACLRLEELVRCAVPLSPWWRRVWPPRGKEAAGSDEGLGWYAGLLERLLTEGADEPPAARPPSPRPEILKGLRRPAKGARADLWTVSLNRQARTALSKSRLAVKGDAAERVFSVRCADLRWAIVDTGIDATHPAFRRRTARGTLEKSRWKTRVVATYDFTRLRAIVAGESGGLDREQRRELRLRIETGQAIDWDALKPLLSVPHGRGYAIPELDHGTHVAGIVGADWRASDKGMPSPDDLIGICPDIELYDLRVFGGPGGGGDEYAITGALQFVRHLNAHSDLQVIHGANLSLSIDHDFASYAVGRTPVCDECERLMGSGVAVVAAAGNDGQAKFTDEEGRQRDGFRTVGITDPGNAQGAITVGSTHRQNPHTYGVSYFSSKGPTGDGREKPDLVAPGEKIASPTPGEDFKGKDGTSQATAHVSGVAAMLMARHPELVGQPAEVKRILCETATDLGRRREFQGNGLVDALRALQAV